MVKNTEPRSGCIDYQGHEIDPSTGRCYSCACRHPMRPDNHFALDLMMVGTEEWKLTINREPLRDGQSAVSSRAQSGQLVAMA